MNNFRSCVSVEHELPLFLSGFITAVPMLVLYTNYKRSNAEFVYELLPF